MICEPCCSEMPNLAAYSSTGSARDLVRLVVEGYIVAIVSEDVLEETERNLRKKGYGNRE